MDPPTSENRDSQIDFSKLESLGAGIGNLGGVADYIDKVAWRRSVMMSKPTRNASSWSTTPASRPTGLVHPTVHGELSVSSSRSRLHTFGAPPVEAVAPDNVGLDDVLSRVGHGLADVSPASMVPVPGSPVGSLAERATGSPRSPRHRVTLITSRPCQVEYKVLPLSPSTKLGEGLAGRFQLIELALQLLLTRRTFPQEAAPMSDHLQERAPPLGDRGRRHTMTKRRLRDSTRVRQDWEHTPSSCPPDSSSA